MPDVDIGQAYRLVQVCQRLSQTRLAHNVISRDMRVTGVDAGADGNQPAQPFQDLGNLLKAPAERILRAGGVFDEDGEASFRQIESLRRGGNGRCRLQQAAFAICTTKRAWM